MLVIDKSIVLTEHSNEAEGWRERLGTGWTCISGSVKHFADWKLQGQPTEAFLHLAGQEV